MAPCRAWHGNHIGSLPAIIPCPFVKHDLATDQEANSHILHSGQREIATATIKPAALIKALFVGEIILIMNSVIATCRCPIKTAIEPQLILDQWMRAQDHRWSQFCQTLHHRLMCLLSRLPDLGIKLWRCTYPGIKWQFWQKHQVALLLPHVGNKLFPSYLKRFSIIGHFANSHSHDFPCFFSQNKKKHAINHHLVLQYQSAHSQARTN